MKKVMMNEVIAELQSRGYSAEATQTMKNGIAKDGVIMGEGKCRPIIYPTKNTVDECVNEIIDVYKDCEKQQSYEDTITSWDFAKDHVFLCLQKQTNEDILKRNYLDLEQYVRVRIADDATYKVKPDMFPNVDTDEIFARAMKNTKEAVFVEDMAKMLAEMMGCELEDVPNDAQCLVITNKEKYWGAASILCSDVLKEIAEEHDSNLVILPSSIHECLIRFDDDPDVEMYNDMVQSVNATEVLPTEVLSNHVYFYNRETGKIEL